MTATNDIKPDLCTETVVNPKGEYDECRRVAVVICDDSERFCIDHWADTGKYYSDPLTDDLDSDSPG